MVSFGFDVDSSGNAVCSVKQWPEKELLCGVQLFVYGSPAPRHSVCPDSFMLALRKAISHIQTTAENLVQSEGYGDLMYAATRLCDGIKEVNIQIWELGAFLGQGIYIGGNIVYLVGSQYFITPFGGGHVYLWDGETLKRRGAKSQDRFIRDAIGAAAVWPGICWKGTLAEGNSILCLTGALNSSDAAADQIRESS